jgi:NNP family nitrate/nitrite transporter-like MFS transporter
MNESSGSIKSKILLLVLVTTIFFLNFLSRILPAPLMPTIEKDLGLDHAGAGGFFLLISIGYCTSLVASGFLATWLTHRKIIILSSVATGFALLAVAASETRWGINLALVFLGLAAGAYLPSGMTTVTSSVKPAHWGKAIGFHEMAPAVAYIAAPLIAEMLLRWLSWKGVLASIGIASMLVGLSFLRIGGGGDFKGETPNYRNVRLLLQQRSFWIMTILFSFGITTSMGIFSMLPLYLVADRGFDRSYANTLISLSRILPVVMALLSGWMSDRLGPERTIKGVMFFNGMMTLLLGIVPGDWLLLMVFLQPMLSACFFPAGFALLSGSTPSNVRNVSVSMTIFFAYLIGAGLIPAGVGIMGDAGCFALAFAVVGGMIFASAILIRYLKYSDIRNA